MLGGGIGLAAGRHDHHLPAGECGLAVQKMTGGGDGAFQLAVRRALRVVPRGLEQRELQGEVAVGLQLFADGGEVRQGGLAGLRAGTRLSGKSLF